MRWLIPLLFAATPALADTVVANGTIRSMSVIGPADVRLVAGDTPGAILDLAAAIGMEARVNLYPGRPIRPGDLWSDEPEDADYNQLVARPYAGSHEALRRGDPLYDLVLVTDWNWPDAKPWRGSCIFLHCGRRPGYPTAGCVAFRPDHLREIAGAIRPGARLIVRPGAFR